MIKKWTLLREEDISPSKWMRVFRHEVRMPDNTLIDDYYITRLGQVALVLPLTNTNEIVFVNQYKHGAGEILLELPAGLLQENKTIEESALAELEEETGIKTTLDNLVSLGKVASNPTKTNHITYGFLARGLSFNSVQKLDLTEDIELVKMSPKQALEKIASGQIWVADTVAFIMRAYLLFPELFR